MRILLIEDDKATAHAVALILTSKNLTCDHVELGIDGIIKGQTNNYDIIILDLMLQDIDGYEVLSKLRSANVRSKIFILSSLSSPEYKIRALSLGADNYFTKPFGNKELISVIYKEQTPAKDSLEFTINTVLIEKNSLQNYAILKPPISQMNQAPYTEGKIIQIIKQFRARKNILRIKFS